MNYYTKNVLLPSNGKLGAPKEVTIRNMTTLEEKILSNARDEKFLFDLVKSCVIEPKDFDPYTCHANDIMCLIFQIRELTFGPTYKQSFECPICGTQQDVEIDISKFEFTLLEADLDKALEVTLPISKDKVTLKILTEADNRECVKLAKHKQKKFPGQNYNDLLFTEKLCAQVVSIELAKPEEGKTALLEMRPERESYLMNMHFADMNAIKQALSKIEFGVKSFQTERCNFCGEEMEVPGMFSPEFFRPTIN